MLQAGQAGGHKGPHLTLPTPRPYGVWGLKRGCRHSRRFDRRDRKGRL
jgi:hypothetical protein